VITAMGNSGGSDGHGHVLDLFKVLWGEYQICTAIRTKKENRQKNGKMFIARDRCSLVGSKSPNWRDRASRYE